MIKARIVTPLQRYEFEVPGEIDDVRGAYTWLTNTLAACQGVIDLPKRVIEIVNPKDVRSIDIWEEQDPQDLLASVKPFTNTPNITDAEPSDYTGEISYLGQSVLLRLISYRLRGYAYFLPQEVNHMPALDTLDHETLGHITEQLLQREGISGTVVLPPVQLGSDKIAQEYVMDYAKDATPPAHFSPHEKTARAVRGLFDEK